MAGARPGITPTMLRRPRCGPLLGTDSKCTSVTARPGSAASMSRSVTARFRSCSEPAGRWPTATWARTSDIARAPSKRFAEGASPLPPHPATAISAAATRTAEASDVGLGRLLALALDAGLGRDRRHRGLVMATGTIPDHVRFGDSLLRGLGLDLGPGKL